jgi:hypothetical protein
MRSLILASLISVAFATPAFADDSDKEAAARAEVDRLLASQHREFAGCFEKSLKTGRLISDATLYFQVEPRGRAANVKVKMSGYAPRALNKCIARCVERLRFPLEASFLTVEHRIQIIESAYDRPQRK